MSNARDSGNIIPARNDGAILSIPAEISCVFRLGKNDHEDQMIECNDLEDFEMDEIRDHRINEVTLNSVASQEAIEKIKNRLKLLSSLQVLSSDGSLISVFNTAAAPSPSSATYTNLETSLDLPIGDIELLQQYINDPSSITDFEFDEDIFKILHEPSQPDPLSDLTTDESMTIQPNQIENTEATNQIEIQPEVRSSLVHHPSVSSVSCMSDDFESSDSYSASTKRKSTGGSYARFGNKKVVKYSNEYHERRIKNNIAVKTSRMKAKERQQSNETKMVQLVEENRSLSDRVDALTKELEILKSLYSQLRPDSANGRQLSKAKHN